MKSISLIIAVLLVLQGFSLAQGDAPKGEVMEFGIFRMMEGQVIVDNAATPDGKEINAPSAAFVRTTDRIPAKKGVRFGYRYRVTGLPVAEREIEFQKVVKHPAFKNEQGEIKTEYSMAIKLPAEKGTVIEVSGYGLDRDEEVVPGKWAFELWHGGKLLVAQSFTVFAVNEDDETPEGIFERFCAAWDAGEQWQAHELADKLVGLGQRAAPLLPKLIARFKHLPNSVALDGMDAWYYEGVGEVLASIGPDALIELVDVIREGESPASREQNIGAGSPALVNAYRISRFELTATVFDMVSMEGLPAMAKLVPLLDDGSSEIRTQACQCLGTMGPAAVGALPRLRELCGDPDARTRAKALIACARVDTETPRMLPLLAAGLRDDRAMVQVTALQIIGCLGKDAAPLKSDLMEALKKAPLDSEDLRMVNAEWIDWTEAGGIARALSLIGLNSVEDCDAIAAALLHASGPVAPAVHDRLLTLLNEGGENAHGAIERLYEASKSRGMEEQYRMTSAVIAMQPFLENLMPEVIRKIVKWHAETPYGKHPFNWLRDSLVLWEEKHKPTETDKRIDGLFMYLMERNRIPPQVLRALYEDNGDDKWRQLAVHFIQLSPGDSLVPIAAWLAGRVADAKGSEREVLIEAVVRIGPAASDAVEPLKRIIANFDWPRDWEKDRSFAEVTTAFVALAQITGDADTWAKASETRLLARLLSCSDEEKKKRASSFCGPWRELGLPAVPHLIRWMEGNDKFIADEAASTLPFLGQQNDEAAKIALPALLARQRKTAEAMPDSLIDVVVRASWEAREALPMLMQCVQRYHSKVEGEAAQAERRQDFWSRYSYNGLANIRKALQAIRAIGPEEARDAIPMIVQTYQEEPRARLYDDRTIRPELLMTLRDLGADMGALAEVWVPRLIAGLEEPAPHQPGEDLRELGIYGPLASSAVIPILRHVGWRGGVDVLRKIAPDDERVKAWLHLRRFESMDGRELE